MIQNIDKFVHKIIILNRIIYLSCKSQQLAHSQVDTTLMGREKIL